MLTPPPLGGDRFGRPPAEHVELRDGDSTGDDWNHHDIIWFNRDSLSTGTDGAARDLRLMTYSPIRAEQPDGGFPMLRLVGLWTEPADVDAFEREYLGVHVPKLHRLPSCTEVRTARCLDGPFFRLTEVLFESLDDIHAALDAEEGQSILSEADALAAKFGVRLDVMVVAEAT